MCVFLLLSSLLRLSFLSDVFDFNDLLNDVAPLSPMPFPIDVNRKEKNDLLTVVFVCLHSFVFTPQIELSECCV